MWWPSGPGEQLSRKAGDADIILVHSRAREDAFVAEGHGTARYDVMYNDFVVVGTGADSAAIAGTLLASDAFTAIATHEATFASRGRRQRNPLD